MTKIKVLHLSKMTGVSGSENHLLTLLSKLDCRRFDVHLYILTEVQCLPLLQDYVRELRQAGVAVSLLVMRRHFDPKLIWTLRKYMRQERFDIVHTHLIHADLYGTLAAKLAGIPTIISSRHNDDRFRRYLALVWLNRFLAYWQKRIVVISDWIGTFLETVEKIPSQKIARIHYGLDAGTIERQADIYYVREQFQIPEGCSLIGTIGRLTEQKGQSYLLSAIKQVSFKAPDLRLLIIGDGDLRKTLEEQATQLGIREHVIFAGYRSDALKLLSGVDFFVFPSLWEGFGLVLLESMALRKAIVASNVSAIPESVLDGKTGFLVPPKDADCLAEAIAALLEDPQLRDSMGQAGYKHLENSFSVEKMVKSTEKLYLEIMSA